MGTAPTAITDQKPLLSQPERILNTFFEPTKTFTDLNRGTSWWMAFVLVSIFSIAFVTTVDMKIGFDQVMQNNLKLASAKQQENMEKMPADQRARVMDMQVKFTRGFSYGYPVVAGIMLLIFAVVFMASFNFGAGAQVSFAKAFAICVYASLPGIGRAVLAIVSILAGKDPESFYIQNPAATNLGYFIDPLQHRFLYSLGTSIDVFGIWTMILIAIGFSCVSKVKRGTAYGIVFAWYFGITLLFAGIGAAMS